jgi:hypothetical protein
MPLVPHLMSEIVYFVVLLDSFLSKAVEGFRHNRLSFIASLESFS